MFKATSRQVLLLGPERSLPEKARERLLTEWAGQFREKVRPLLLRVESDFAVLYADTGRPNRSVATYLGLLILQDMFNIGDQAALDAMVYDIRWQYALGLDPADVLLSRRSLVGFRSRLVEHDPSGTLLRGVFTTIAGAAIDDLRISIGQQRMDSTHVVSNIMTKGRTDLFAKTLRVFLRLLPEAELASLRAELRHWFLQDEEAEQRVALQTLAVWVHEMWRRYADDPVIAASEPYAMLERLLTDHCEIQPAAAEGAPDTSAEPSSEDNGGGEGEGEGESEGGDEGGESGIGEEGDGGEPRGGLEHGGGDEHSTGSDARAAGSDTPAAGSTVTVREKPINTSTSLQSPHDPDAGYGNKGPGYEVQIVETMGNGEVTEIITDYEVHPSGKPDWGEAPPAIERLEKAGLKPEKLTADGQFADGESLLKADAAGVDLIAPAHRTRLPKDAVLRNRFEFDDDGRVVRCPEGHAPLRHGRRTSDRGRSVFAFFDSKLCEACPLRGKCVSRPPNGPKGSSGSWRVDVTPALRRRDAQLARQETKEFAELYRQRSGIEATNSELARAHGMKRLRVRRLARVRVAVMSKVTACNVKRWFRRKKARRPPQRPRGWPTG